MNAAFEATGLDWLFTAFDVEIGRHAGALDAMRALRMAGMLVTMPHKAGCAASVDRLTQTAERFGAVNCVFWDGDDLVGDSTDGDGLIRGLRVDHEVTVEGRRVGVIGAGGAARSIIDALARHGAAEIVVVNRSEGSARSAAELAGDVGRVGVASDLSASDVVINATPIGMGTDRGEGGTEMPCDPAFLRANQVVVDIVYHPLETAWLAAARGSGALGVDGLSMLIGQACVAFERWTGCDAPAVVMRAGAERQLAETAT